MTRLHPRDRRNALVLTALLLGLYYPAIGAWASGGWAFGQDAPGLFAPWRAFAASEIQAGRWPLWNPWVFGGLPLALNGQAALGYPPNLVFWILPFKTALLLDALAHSILLGLGGYFLGRALRLSRTAATLLALCLSLNGGVSAHVYAGHVTWHAARAWTPWMLWALALGLRTRRLRYAYLLALFFFLQFAAGYPPLALMGAGFCAAGFVGFLLLTLFDNDLGRLDLRRRAGEASWMWRWALVAGALGAGLVLSLALPLREVSGLSVHGSGLPWSQASELSGTWKSLARWIVPGAFNMARPFQWSLPYGAHEEASAIAILPTMLAVGAPLWARGLATRRQMLVLWALWSAMLGCVALALGASTPLYRLLFEHIGLLRVLRFPVRWLEPWSIVAALAAALTFDIWHRSAKIARSELQPELQDSTRRHLWATLRAKLRLASMAALLLGAAVIGAACWLASRGAGEFWMPLLRLIEPTLSPESQVRLSAMLRGVALSECAWAAAWCGATALLLALARRDWAGTRWHALIWKLAIVLVAIELGNLFVRSRATWRAGQPEIPTALAARYQRGERWVTSVQWQSIDAGMAAGVEVFNGYDAMNTRAFWDLAQAVEGRALWVDMYQPSRLSSPLRIAGVTHALMHRDLPLPLPPGARLEGRVREWSLWRIAQPRDVWPRLFLTRRARSMRSVRQPDLSSALSEMARLPAPRPGQDWPLLLTEGASDSASVAAGWGAATSGSSGRVEQWRARPNVLACRVVARESCWLGISQAWSPAWKAWVNGRPARLERANGPFCALRLERGVSEIRLAYVPQTWRLSEFVGLCALAMLGAGGGAWQARRALAARQRQEVMA